MSGPWGRFNPFTGAEKTYLSFIQRYIFSRDCHFKDIHGFKCFSSEFNQCWLSDILTIYTPYYRIPPGREVEEIVKFGDEGSLNFLFAGCGYAKSFCLCKVNILRLKFTPPAKTNLCQFIKVSPGQHSEWSKVETKFPLFVFFLHIAPGWVDKKLTTCDKHI